MIIVFFWQRLVNMSSVPTEFEQLVNEYRPTVSQHFAELVDHRLNQSYAPSLQNLELDNKDFIKDRFKRLVNNKPEQAIKSFSQKKEGFISFLKHLGTHITRTLDVQFEECDSCDRENDEDSLYYYAYVVLACRYYFCGNCSTNTEFRNDLLRFVENITTRIYRLPETARYIYAINTYFESQTCPEDKACDEEYTSLLTVIKEHC